MYKYAVLPVLALSACASPPPPYAGPNDQSLIAAELAGRVAGQPTQCLPGFARDEMRAVGNNAVLIRDGSTTWLSNTDGNCRSTVSGGLALVIEKRGTDSLCRGDIAKVVDLQSGALFGTCSFGDFVPYRRP